MQMKKTSTLKRVLIMAGGTGGHIFPGLALARYLQEKGIEVHWLGTASGMEARLVPEANLPLHCIAIGGLRGKGVKTLLRAPLTISRAVWQARRIIKQVNPDAVIGLGGFVSGPGGIAAWLKGRPLIIHEQNAKAGFTNQWLARFAAHILEGFPHAFKQRRRVTTVGNPVRAEIESLPPPQSRFQATRTPCRLLVLGGSLGAQAINELVPEALAKLPATARPTVMHQTGDKHFASVQAHYARLGIHDIQLVPFVADMASAYGWADVVLCRAGALTVSELCAAGLGAIFVPFPYAVDDHQTANANYMVRHHAAICVQQQQLTVDVLVDILQKISINPQKRSEMAQAAYQLRHPHVVDDIFKLLCRTVHAKA